MKISSSFPSATDLLIVYSRKSSLWKCGADLANPFIKVIDASSCVDLCPLIRRYGAPLYSGYVRRCRVHGKSLTRDLRLYTASVVCEPIPLFNQREIRLRPLLRLAVDFLLRWFLNTWEWCHGTYWAIHSWELPLLHKTGSSCKLTQGLKVRAVLNHYWRLLMIRLWLLHHPTLTHLLDSLLQERLLLCLLLGSWLVRVCGHQGRCLGAPNSPVHSNQLIGSLHGGLLYQVTIFIV